MKYLMTGLLLIVWLVMTLALIISLVGLIVILLDHTWNKIGMKLVKVFDS